MPQPARGRPRRFCSDACRQRDYRRRAQDATAHGLVTLVEGDARELLRGLAPESVELVVTDPPYVFARGSGFRERFADLPDSAWGEVLEALYRVLREDRHRYLLSDRRTYPIFEEAARAGAFASTIRSSGTATGSAWAGAPGARSTSL